MPVICRHIESINSENVGTCRLCGQRRQYHDGEKPVLLKRGRINGEVTFVTPPDLTPLPIAIHSQPALCRSQNQENQSKEVKLSVNIKCDKCGGQIAVEEGRYRCHHCDTVWAGAFERAAFRDAHREAILRDHKEKGATWVVREWGIRPSTLHYCIKRWTRPEPANQAEEIHIPGPVTEKPAFTSVPYVQAPTVEVKPKSPSMTVMVITGDDLERIPAEEFTKVWSALGVIMQCRREVALVK